MFLFKRAAAPVPRYQTIRGAVHNPRPLTLEQRAIFLCCEKPVTLAELAKATRLPMSVISEALRFLCAHALVRIL